MTAVTRTQTILFLAGFCAPVCAQSPAHHRLRVLALGDPPPFVQEVRDGVRYEMAPPVGSIPPRLVKLATGGDTIGTLAATPLDVRVRLGRPTEAVVFPLPGSNRIELRSDNGTPWLNVPLHECGSSLVLAWRGAEGWNQAKAVVVPDDLRARAEGGLHFTNLAAGPMALVLGAEKLRLNPGVTVSRSLAPGAAPLPLEIFYPTVAGGLALCHTSMLEPTRGSFRRFIMYMADGKRPKLPVKVAQIEESSGEPAIVSNTDGQTATKP